MSPLIGRAHTKNDPSESGEVLNNNTNRRQAYEIPQPQVQFLSVSN